ncbi:MAG: hypothetical protein HZY76_21750 [Anaerolineae bacterium]|nr:MAG: hypothetical protein HZY76_21750 [Anaerolineae bacterium]
MAHSVGQPRHRPALGRQRRPAQFVSVLRPCGRLGNAARADPPRWVAVDRLPAGAGFDWRIDRGLLQVLDGTLEISGRVVLGEGCRVFVKDGGVLRFLGDATVAGRSQFLPII